MTVTVLGADPGITCGFAVLSWADVTRPPEAHVYGCDYGSAPGLLHWLLDTHQEHLVCAQVEAFTEGKRSRTGRPQDAAITRALVSRLAGECSDHGVPVVCRSAGLVKPWATDERLRAAGVLEMTAKMVDCKDAARHALYCASKDTSVPDPLSTARRASAKT